MAASVKVIITSKKNLQSKYGTKFKTVHQLLSRLIKADAKRNIKTRIVYIDDAASAKAAGITAATAITRPVAKKKVDEVYKKLNPAYIVLFGAQDVFPFQELVNPVFDPGNDDDQVVPSDLPYACDAAYGREIASFTGPSRVVGRIPDIPQADDVDYVKTVIDTIVNYKQVKPEDLMDYFAVTASVWKNSTGESLSNMFGNNVKMKISPPATTGYPVADLSPRTHFYNCHGSPIDSNFYGQKGNNFPSAKHSPNLRGKITPGTIVAAECCYGAGLYNPADEGTTQLSIANTYFLLKAIAFTGSSTIAYGPSSGQALADLITQYFIANVISGASTGRALLEARMKFLTTSGPDLDPYEMKTLAQFYLLGDPSVQVVEKVVIEMGGDTVENRRLNLSKKGASLAKTIAPSKKVESVRSKGIKTIAYDLKEVLKQTGFTGGEQQAVYVVKSKGKTISGLAKSKNGGGNGPIKFRTLITETKKARGLKDYNLFDVLVLKESGNNLLAWRIYHRK